MLLTVARIGRAHGLRGEVGLDLRTDAPDERLATGSVLATDRAGLGSLTVTSTRIQQGRWYVTFAEVRDRTEAEGLRGVALLAEEDTSDDDDAWYPHELAGLRAEHVDGRLLGEVVGLEHLPAHDVLVLREPDGARTLVPFVRAIVPVVDVAGGRVVLDPPGGLLASDAANLVVSDETSGPAGESDDRADDEGV
ncbi:MAG: ribosome maturation factor RimM [Cellulomonas sp.]|uniref:Ribosome maturation factor RimM n=1 Tax=Cellulomonas gelida TaxID=1712 RepID=A0A4Y3KP72_9CELL|nr:MULTISPECIES: ribosome maturation factor RimM [Cellulomonas]KMM47279.1 16S rRNA processing protein RimM [Cellulomonas sp. A375-1]MCR6647026.1 ribosome maturation factor RimM [Cellulomonas sp.]MCR6706120.1 ribosome maturation factor RimM [Cellulomonas sp.]GEA84740.1 ribosome maturation factor RimM [Cellulomonas gelida]GGL28436.1 ribosome maturation factor RimM [Cellulomonas gelida]